MHTGPQEFGSGNKHHYVAVAWVSGEREREIEEGKLRSRACAGFHRTFGRLCLRASAPETSGKSHAQLVASEAEPAVLFGASKEGRGQWQEGGQTKGADSTEISTASKHTERRAALREDDLVLIEYEIA